VPLWMQKTRNFLRRFPLLGPLADCSWSDHAETIKQVAITLLFGTAPFWLGALLFKALSSDQNLTIMSAFWSTVWGGELFMCATSLLAPIFWIALDDPKGVAKFPSRSMMMVAVVLITFVASVFFAEELSHSHLQQPFTFHVSVYTFGAAVAVLYLSTVYHTNRVNVPRAFRDEEQSFQDAYKRHRS
jgi:hypothetical protein